MGFCNDQLATVWPGDINHDGIVNNQDDALLFLYYNSYDNIGRPEPGIIWQAHFCLDWGIPIKECYFNDIKHFDCDGNGSINSADKNAILLNWGFTHNDADNKYPSIYTFGDFPSETKIYLQANGGIVNNQLTMDIVLETSNSKDLEIFGGFFTIQYPSLLVTHQSLVFTSSWLGNPNNNLNMDYKDFPQQQKVEIAFSRTDGINAVGSGIIGQVIFSLNNTNFRQKSKTEILDFEIVDIGVHNKNGQPTGIPNQYQPVKIGVATCAPSIIITENTAFQNLYKSDSTIATNGYLPIGQNQQVEYQANRITLNKGFKVNAGADYSARYGSCSIAANGLIATYFNNINFTGSSITRIDSTINFDWIIGSPDTAIDPDTFSARWEGFIEAPASGAYTFFTNTDDGLRLWINNQLIIDWWVDQAATEVLQKIQMTAGEKVPIKMEYYENYGAAVVQLRWEGPGIAKQIIPANYLFTE